MTLRRRSSPGELHPDMRATAVQGPLGDVIGVQWVTRLGGLSSLWN